MGREYTDYQNEMEQLMVEWENLHTAATELTG